MSGEAETARVGHAAESKARRGWWVPVVAAGLLTWVGALWIGLGQGLASVSLVRADLTYPGDDSTTTRMMLITLTAAGLMLFTGYRRSPVGRVDGVALTGGVWVLGWVGLMSTLWSGFEFNGPDHMGGPVDTCVYARCGPACLPPFS